MIFSQIYTIIMATYPSGIFSPRTRENKSGVVYDAAKKTVIFVEDQNKGDDEVVAVQTELGTIPKGDFASVKARLENNENVAIAFIIDGGGAEIATGEHGHLEIPFKCEIQRVTLLADQSGSIIIDIWKDTYANFPPDNADSITSSAPPTITTAVKSQDATLTGWTKEIAAGDILSFNVDSVTDIERVTLVLFVKKIA